MKTPRLAINLGNDEIAADERLSIKDSTKTVMAELSADAIEQNRFPPRDSYPEDMVDAMAASIQRHGQRDAIHVMLSTRSTERYTIGDGWTRVLAIRKSGYNDGRVRALIHYGITEREIAWLGFSQNEDRTPFTVYDRARFFTAQHEAGASWTEIAERANLSNTTLTYYGSFSKLSQRLRDFLAAEPRQFDPTALYYLSRLEAALGVASTLALARTYVKNQYSRAWLTGQVQKAEGKRTAKSERAIGMERRFKAGSYTRTTAGAVTIKLRVPKQKSAEFDKAFLSLLKRFHLADK